MLNLALSSSLMPLYVMFGVLNSWFFVFNCSLHFAILHAACC